MKSSLSEKELEFISRLELKKKYFFARDDIREHFTSTNEMNVYIHRLRKKGRIIKLNKTKYYLIPVRAVGRKWSEHPFIIIDEIMNGKDYCIVGKAAAHYWKLIDQIPFVYEVYNNRIHKKAIIFNARIEFRKRRNKNMPKGVVKEVYGHTFIIADKEGSAQWK